MSIREPSEFRPAGRRVPATVSPIIITRITAELLSPMWGQVHHWLMLSSLGLDVEPADLLPGLSSGLDQLWCANGADVSYGAFRTGIYATDVSRAVAVYDLHGARLQDWVGEMEEVVMRFGRAQGCSALRLTGLGGLDEYAPAYKSVGEHLGWTTYERAL